MSRSTYMRVAFFVVALISTSNLFAQGNKPPCNTADSLALVALYNATDGANWKTNYNWLAENRWVRNWYGVEFEGDLTDRVVKLKLNSNDLAGALPEEIGDLSELENLYLNGNQITAIPASIGNLPKLEGLYLGGNALSTVPLELASMTSLKVLELSGNPLSTVPQVVVSIPSLVDLRIAQIGLNGMLPAFIASIQSLERLNISYNELTSIPDDIGTLPRLKWFSSAANQLSGDLDEFSFLADLDSLQILDLYNNQLQGPIPDWIGQLTQLENLNLANNDLSGEIPEVIGNLVNLQELRIEYNRFHGAIPESINNLTNLRKAWIYRNYFTDLPILNPFAEAQFQSSEFQITHNRFTFEDIIPNLGAATSFRYSPQYEAGFAIQTSADLGETKMLSWQIGGAGNEYQWTKDLNPIPNAIESELVLENITTADAGSYRLKITNPLAPDLTLETHPIHLAIQPLMFCEAPGKMNGIAVIGNPSQSSCGLATENNVIVLEIVGEAELVRENSDPVELHGGEILVVGDRVYTGIESTMVIAFPDNSTVTVNELSDIKITAFTSLGDAVQTRLWLKAGEVAAKVQRESAVKSDFLIKTPTVTASVRGTEFSVRHDEALIRSEVRVGAGEVAVIPDYSEADSVRLSPFEVVSVGESSISGVAPIVVERIEIEPGIESVGMQGVRRFLAFAYDAFDNKIPVPVVWSAGGGDIDEDGYYVAGDITGSYEVSATEPLSNLTAVAAVTVTPVAGVTVDTADIPEAYELQQNYPNPFNPHTRITYRLENAGPVELAVFNVLGKRIITLENGFQSSGEYAVNFDGSDLSSGVYFYMLVSGDYIRTRKMVLLK